MLIPSGTLSKLKQVIATFVRGPVAVDPRNAGSGVVGGTPSSTRPDENGATVQPFVLDFSVLDGNDPLG